MTVVFGRNGIGFVPSKLIVLRRDRHHAALGKQGGKLCRIIRESGSGDEQQA